MEQSLSDLGFNEKEIMLYMSLLKKPKQSAQQLAKQNGIQRTNIYHLLDNLIGEKLVTHEDSPVRLFSVAEPKALRDLLQRKQTSLKQAAGSLSTALPQFVSQYSLALDKPGVVHMTGNDGFEQLLLDMAHSKTEILLVASDYTPQDADILTRFRELQLERKRAGIATRALFHNGNYSDRLRKEFTERGIDTRFIGYTPFSGEVAVYEDNVAFTVYDPSLIVTVITNVHIASTMRLLFEELWQKAA